MVYARRGRSGMPPRPGPATLVSEDQLVRLIRQVLATSPFAGEGYRKVRPRLRRDWGPQYRSPHFLGSIGWLGIADDPAFLGEPETNGCAERWIRTLKEQCLWVELHDTIDQLRQAVTGFVDRYNTSWLIQRHGHLTPKEAYQAAQAAAA
jgi:transposase InsO family protein